MEPMRLALVIALATVVLVAPLASAEGEDPTTASTSDEPFTTQTDPDLVEADGGCRPHCVATA